MNDQQNLSPDEQKTLLDRAKARQIVTEILDFGVTNNQVRELIKLLALELDNREEMLKIYEFLNESGTETVEQKIYT